MQINRPAQHYAHYDAETGEILGLYNTNKHKSIPKSSVPITVEDRDDIQSRPQDFRVKNGDLFEAQNSQHLPDVTSTLESNRRTYELTVGKGVMVDGVCYFADDEASAHATQCLLVATNTKFKAKLKAMIDGKPQYVTVKSREDLVRVVKEINVLRAEAKERLLQDNQTAVELSQHPQ